MKKSSKKFILNILIILVVIIIALLIIKTPRTSAKEEIAKCIGQNSALYIQLGCHACETQEQMFGENYKYLNVIDCYYEREKCTEISATPTWIINNQKYLGVQSIEKLKELTNCE